MLNIYFIFFSDRSRDPSSILIPVSQQHHDYLSPPPHPLKRLLPYFIDHAVEHGRAICSVTWSTYTLCPIISLYENKIKNLPYILIYSMQFFTEPEPESTNLLPLVDVPGNKVTAILTKLPPLQQGPQRPCRGLILCLNGSFNPVHNEHLSLLDSARAYLEQQGLLVVGGFLSPSSECYVNMKKGEDALPLALRAHLCALATSESEWISATKLGICSGREAADTILSRLTSPLPRNSASTSILPLMKAKGISRLATVQVMGLDTLVRCGWARRAESGKPRGQQQRRRRREEEEEEEEEELPAVTVVAVERPGTDIRPSVRRTLEETGVMFAPRSEAMSAGGVSSTNVLKWMKSRTGTGGEALHPRVREALVGGGGEDKKTVKSEENKEVAKGRGSGRDQ